MTFEDLPTGTAVFLDANVFIYSFDGHPVFGAACQQLLLRIETKDLQGFTSAHILANVSHRLMTLEATRRAKRSATGIVSWLQNHPVEVQNLSRYRQAIDEINLIGVHVLPVSGSLVSLAADASRQFGLLTDDALVVAVMRDQGLTMLASNDADFDRVPGITRFSPT